MVDLDAVEKAAMTWPADGQVRHAFLALVAELRAAREVVDQARLQSRPHAHLRKAIAAYDQAVAS